MTDDLCAYNTRRQRLRLNEECVDSYAWQELRCPNGGTLHGVGEDDKPVCSVSGTSTVTYTGGLKKITEYPGSGSGTVSPGWER